MATENEAKFIVRLPLTPGVDIAPSVTGMLEDLYLLGSDEDMRKADAPGTDQTGRLALALRAESDGDAVRFYLLEDQR